jgi:ribulose-phosphate 3-epimerase
MKPIISASILNCDFGNLASELKKAEDAGVDAFHMDIMDGQYVPNISIGPDIVAICRRLTKLPMDTHLMINNPENFIEPFAKAGSDTITIHIENSYHIHKNLSAIHALGKKAGIVLNPGTPIESIYEVLHMVDLILIMSVNPGFGGQKFIESSLDKVRRMKKELLNRNLDIPIQVDGGIKDDTGKKMIEAGADILVAGTYIYRNPKGIKYAVDSLRGD